MALIWGVPTFLTFSLSWPVFYFRARAGRFSERDQSAGGLPLLLRLQRLTKAVATNVRSHTFAKQVVWQVFGAKWRRSLERSTVLCGSTRREPPCPGPPSYTGHFSSFHAISQNIHSYRELMTNDSSIRRFSSLPAVLAHWSTFFRIQRWTSANSGEA